MDAEQELAASRMAAAQRGKQARKEASEQKAAASKVAAAKKGQNDRRQRAKERSAATSVQAQVRGRSTRKQLDPNKQRYYTPAEVAAHNRADDLWVTLF